MRIIDGKVRLEYSQELLDMIQPGNSVRLFPTSNFWEDRNNPDSFFHEVCVVRSIVDDEYIVYQVWSFCMHCWVYRIDHICKFQRYYERDCMMKMEEPE